MELIRCHHNLQVRHAGCVASIGNFDGVHLGHRAILKELARHGRRLGLAATVVLFEPQPTEFFAGERAPPRLMRLREKLGALEACGLERVFCLRFDRKLAGMSAEDFIEGILVRGLALRHLVVGDDFRFGAGRRGDFEMLRAHGQRHGFQVQDTPSVELDGVRVSSTAIRAALGRGDLVGAERLLGRPYAICGRVSHGDRLGRSIGFPTANLRLHRHVVPVRGVYAVRVDGLAGGPRQGVANVGRRPTVNGADCLLEVHLLDFDGELYGRQLQVAFLRRLRDERRFESLQALQAQIASDVASARDWFSAAPVS